MKYTYSLSSRNGASIVEIVISMVFISIAVLVITGVAGPVKDFCVSGENRHEATSLSTYMLEKLLRVKYTDTSLDTGTHDSLLPDCDLKNKHEGQRSYTVTEKNWDSNGLYKYKEIIVTTRWAYKVPESVSFGALKRKP